MPIGDVLDEKTERIAAVIVDCIFKVHSAFGAGLLESIYERCLILEIESRGLKVESQVQVSIEYAGQVIEPGLRLDLMVENLVLVEVKAVETMHPVFRSQLKTYLKLTGLRLGILVNFNVPLIKDGTSRVIL